MRWLKSQRSDFFFFFQAEDGIRDKLVTGVQTCALPILRQHGEPGLHLIGIAVDITEQKSLVEKTAAADLRLRDAIETIPEAFVLWDADNRLVLCNSNFQSLHNLPDVAISAGRSEERRGG